MSPLAEALVAAQRRSLATLEKAYVADLIDKEELSRQMSLIGLADTMDGAFLLALSKSAVTASRWARRKQHASAN